MTFLGAALFVLIFVLIMPQCQAALHSAADSAGSFLHGWAPFSYIVLALLMVGPLAAMYIVHTWPQHEEPENPMAKYRREQPSVEDD